ncbi:hypothetical protein N8353_04690 [Octadecabacter sp.]|nr:hypothetical protein [Octadecabacter sp.]
MSKKGILITSFGLGLILVISVTVILVTGFAGKNAYRTTIYERCSGTSDRSDDWCDCLAGGMASRTHAIEFSGYGDFRPFKLDAARYGEGSFPEKIFENLCTQTTPKD